MGEFGCNGLVSGCQGLRCVIVGYGPPEGEEESQRLWNDLESVSVE